MAQFATAWSGNGRTEGVEERALGKPGGRPFPEVKTACAKVLWQS